MKFYNRVNELSIIRETKNSHTTVLCLWCLVADVE